MRKKISFAGPSVSQKEMDSVMDAVQNGWYDNYDKHTRLLEEKIKSLLGVKYAIATHTCTLALHTACAAIGLTKGDEVIVTNHSWIATGYAVTYTGATCVFVDIEPTTLCIDPIAIEKAITPATKAIMLVHNFGIPAKMDEIMEIAKKYKLMVIEDAAPALGATYKGNNVGIFGDISCFSFQGAKIAVSGEGGVLVTNDEALYLRAADFVNMGRTDRVMPFWSDSLGCQYTISNLCASLALPQVERLDELVSIKRNIYNWYSSRLSNHPKITMVKEDEGTSANYCYPSLFLDESTKTARDDILSAFKELNIHARPGFPQMNQFPVYDGTVKHATPVAENFEKFGLVLPSAANLSEEDIDFVCQTLLSLID